MSGTLRSLILVLLAGLLPVKSASAQDAVDFAMLQLGKPYVLGATGPDAFDCSGLTQYAFAKVGVQLPRTSKQQSEITFGVRVLSGFQRGDLLFYATDDARPGVVSHVGLYVGNGQWISAQTPKPLPNGQVILSAVTNGFWAPRFVYGIRVLSAATNSLSAIFDRSDPSGALAPPIGFATMTLDSSGAIDVQLVGVNGGVAFFGFNVQGNAAGVTISSLPAGYSAATGLSGNGLFDSDFGKFNSAIYNFAFSVATPLQDLVGFRISKPGGFGSINQIVGLSVVGTLINGSPTTQAHFAMSTCKPNAAGQFVCQQAGSLVTP